MSELPSLRARSHNSSAASVAVIPRDRAYLKKKKQQRTNRRYEETNEKVRIDKKRKKRKKCAKDKTTRRFGRKP